MSTIDVSTISKWVQLDVETRVKIQRHVQLKDRLLKWLMQQRTREPITVPTKVPCNKCNRSDAVPPEMKGYIVLEPRMPGIHPSEFCGPCARKVYYTLVGADSVSQVDPQLQMVFDLGTAAHLMLQGYGMKGAWGRDTGYTPEYPLDAQHQEISKLLMLEGHADADTIQVINDIPGDNNTYLVGVVHEYKTISANGFSSLSKPKPEHIRQAMIYAAVLDRPLVGYLYLNKNDSLLRDFVVPYDHEVWSGLQRRMEAIIAYYRAGAAPDGEVSYGCKDCKYVYRCETYANSKPPRS